jgi:magnesium-transporting ATPase (P-type)
VIGFVVYTGEDTKIMMNSLFKTSRKVSKFDGTINVFIFYIFLLQILMSLVLSTLSQFIHPFD